jgi:hypothetical protein
VSRIWTRGVCCSDLSCSLYGLGSADADRSCLNARLSFCLSVCVSVCSCVCVCVRACVRACVHAQLLRACARTCGCMHDCVRVCVCASVRAHATVCVLQREQLLQQRWVIDALEWPRLPPGWMSMVKSEVLPSQCACCRRQPRRYAVACTSQRMLCRADVQPALAAERGGATQYSGVQHCVPAQRVRRMPRSLGRTRQSPRSRPRGSHCPSPAGRSARSSRSSAALASKTERRQLSRRSRATRYREVSDLSDLLRTLRF